MIKSLTLKAGRSRNAPSETIDLTSVTVFVGPNNSGKSLLLRELFQRCNGGDPIRDQVIADATYNGFTPAEAITALAAVDVTGSERMPQGQIAVGTRNTHIRVDKAALLELLQDPNSDQQRYCKEFLRWHTANLDGKSRLALLNEVERGEINFQRKPRTTLEVLFKDDAARGKMRQIIFDAFYQYIVLDLSSWGHLHLAFSSTPPPSPEFERSFHDEALDFLKHTNRIASLSDGVIAFTGIIMEVLMGDPHVLLIDEPEAFLHPSLAFRLGGEVARMTHAANKRLFVATHSPSFVMGCIQAGVPTNIVRLTYQDGVATARVLESAQLLRLMRNPLLRSTNLIGAIFYEYVVVTEGDADRAFYQEINERLLRFKPEWGIPHCLFINAQSKQAIPSMIAPLRQLGIPAVGIFDVDVLKDGGQTWMSYLKACGVPAVSHASKGQIRGDVLKALTGTGKDMKRDGGLNILNASDYEAATNLLRELAEYGMFVVPGGELQSWLPSLGAKGHNSSPWLVDAFERMGEDSTSSHYLKPESNDVWAFMRKLKEWLSNPDRKGIPR